MLPDFLYGKLQSFKCNKLDVAMRTLVAAGAACCTREGGGGAPPPRQEWLALLSLQRAAHLLPSLSSVISSERGPNSW